MSSHTSSYSNPFSLLLSPLRAGALTLKHRVVMAPLTRMRSAQPGDVPLSPYGSFGDMYDSDPVALFRYVLEQLSRRRIAYAHLVEPRVGNAGADVPLDHSAERTAEIFRTAFEGVLISAGGYTPEEAERALETKHADAIAFGRLFIANPDLPERIRQNAPLNRPDRTTFYGGTEVGYTDYPALEGSAEDKAAAEASLR